jgi:hypothetical protein
MPRALTVASVAVAVWTASGSGEPWTGIAPAAVAGGCTVAAYALWLRRGRPWHDWTVIGLCLPAVAAAVWIAVGGLVVGVERTDAARLLFEVGPGVALTGLLCTLVSYHGRHRPDDPAGGATLRA